MLALAILVLNHVTVIDVVRGVAQPNRAIEIEGSRIRAILPAAGYRSARGRCRSRSSRTVCPAGLCRHARARPVPAAG